MDEPLTRAMAVAQRFVRGDTEVEATMRELVELATVAIGADMAGLTARDERGRANTVVYTDRIVREIDEAQYESGRGPCLDAARTHAVFEVEDMDRDGRWPEFATSAKAHGVRSSLSVPVVAANDGLGALNLYDRRPSFFDGPKRQVALAFAGHCALVGLYWSAKHEVTTLAAALDSRATIEQAKGVIMGATGCTPDDAFDLLRQQSQRENRKLREIAEEVVARQKR